MPLAKIAETLRAGAAGIVATLVDLGVLALLVSVFHVDARIASIPALLAGGVANFVGNRWFVFRATSPGSSLAKQAAGYSVVEIVALGFNALLFDVVLRVFPILRAAYAVVRLVTSNLVFLGWSLPMWRRVFRTETRVSRYSPAP
jgi:putative flippase GtrA